MSPKRIQRRRAKGWRLPEGAVCVDRSTKWGNPFVVDRGLPRAECVTLFRLMLGGYICISLKSPTPTAQYAYRAMAKHHLVTLRGKNLACWCPPGPCHADVLIEAANR